SPTDPVTGNNSSSVTTTIGTGQQSADLAITKTGPASVTARQMFIYTLAVHNNGPNTATSVKATDALPVGLTFVSASTGCANSSVGTVNCTLASLASGADASFTIAVTLNPPPPATSLFPYTTLFRSSPTDPVTGNNSSSVTTTIGTGQQSADLSIT